MEIRKAQKKDLEQIVKLNSQLTDYHHQIDKYYTTGKEVAKSFRKHLKEVIEQRDCRIMVVSAKGKLIGFSLGHITKTKPYVQPNKIGHLSNVFVSPLYQKKGIGKILFTDFLKWAEQKKIKNIELSVDARNKIGIAAWKKFGFKDFQNKMRLDI